MITLLREKIENPYLNKGTQKIEMQSQYYLPFKYNLKQKIDKVPKQQDEILAIKPVNATKIRQIKI